MATKLQNIEETVPHCGSDNFGRAELRWGDAEDVKETENDRHAPSCNSDPVGVKPNPSAASLQNLSTVLPLILSEKEAATTTRPEEHKPSPQAALEDNQANDCTPLSQMPSEHTTTSISRPKVRFNMNIQCYAEVEHLKPHPNEEEEGEDIETFRKRKEKAWRFVGEVLKLHESIQSGGKLPPPASPFRRTHGIALVAMSDVMVRQRYRPISPFLCTLDHSLDCLY